MIFLLSFVQTGRLGNVGLGMSRTQVEQAFGVPNDWWATSPRRELSPICKYGNLEIHFSGDALFLIFCDDFYVPANAPLAFDLSDLGQCTEADVEFWLQRHQIPFESFLSLVR